MMIIAKQSSKEDVKDYMGELFLSEPDVYESFGRFIGGGVIGMHE